MSSVSSDLLPFPFLCPSLFFLLLLPPILLRAGKSSRELIPRRSGTAERRRSSKSHNQYEAVYSAGGGSATPERNRPQCLQSDRVRRVTFNSEPLAAFYGGGFIKQGAFVFRARLNKYAAGPERLLRYLHPHKDKTTSRRKRIMGSGDPS